MADTAEQRLRGILARDHNAATIDALLAEVRAEWAGAEQPIPCEATGRPRWADTSSLGCYARACLICPWETERSTSADAVAQQMEQHLVSVHGRGTSARGTLTVQLDQRTVDSVLVGPIHRVIKDGR